MSKMTKVSKPTIKKMEKENNEKSELLDNVDEDDICELEHLRKLFIGGLPPQTNEESLREFYSQWGKVVDVVVMKDPESKRSRGFGFITYTKSFMVDKAQENRPHNIDGKTVEAKRALPRPEREAQDNKSFSVKKLFVGGLKDNHDEDCLEEYFSQFGNVVSVKILTDRASGKRRGFAFVEYDDYDAVDKAILQQHHSIKYVVVDVKKSSYSKELQKRNALNENGVGNYDNRGRNNKNNAPQQQQQPMPQQDGPPPAYNPWGPPAPVMPPQQYAYQQPPMQPQQMPTWNYAPAPQWSAPPQAPPQPPPQTWQNNQWGYPPPAQYGPPGPMPAPAAQPPANWQQPPAAPQPVAGPPPQQQQSPPNYGTGYQQNYGGGPTKQNNSNSNRMNPYNNGPAQVSNGNSNYRR